MATSFPGFEAFAEHQDQMLAALVKRRRRLGLSQTAVAARMGTSQSAVARLEAGGSDPKLSTLARYAAAVGISVRYDIGDEER
jgi:predicted transcriptional regulator